MDKENRKKIIKSILLFTTIVIFGITGYMLIEGWNLIDSVYMTIITLATVGYGETNELSNSGRIFTIFLIIFGLGSAASVLNSFATVLLDNKLNNYFGRKAMNAEIKKMKNHVILCGLGQIGIIIAVKLQEKHIPFVIVDNNMEEIEKCQQLGFVSVNGNITLDATLLNAGINRAKTIVICSSDITINLTLSLAAKELNPNIEVIAQGVDYSLESRITRAGADVVVYPLALGGEQISEIIANNYKEKQQLESISFQAIDGYFMKMYQHFNNEPITIEAVVKKEKGLRAIALKQKSSKIVDNPNQDIEMFKDDYIIILLNQNMLNQNTCEEVHSVQAKIEWSDEYSVGNSSIDEEHLRLINLINRFNEALIKGESKNALANIFDRLIDYTLEHFKNEEELMREHNYPELEAHIIEHQKLINTVMEFNKQKDYLSSDSILEFLNMWLIEHIITCDIKYKGYI